MVSVVRLVGGAVIQAHFSELMLTVDHLRALDSIGGA